MPIIREAHPRDASRLSVLAESTFRDTFASVNTSENMELHCQLSYSEALQAAEIANPTMRTILGEADGQLIGFAQLGWGSAPKCVSALAPGKIHRLYVSSEWHGKGVAQDLMKACVEELKRRGSDAVWLGVWERNARAITFYRKFGFVDVGDIVFPLGNDPQRDIVMFRALGS